MTRYYCPICKKPVEFENNPYRPFCSKRCKLIDLGKWADNKYYIPGEDRENSEDEEDPNRLQ